MPAPDNLDRDKFYASGEDDDAEYELEEPDPALKAADERRKAEAMAALNRSIDIDEVYREHESSRSSEILHDWVKSVRGGFRFQVKHLLIATAVVAIAMTLWTLNVLGTALVLLLMFGIRAIGMLRIPEDEERQGIDIAEHGAPAYHPEYAYMGYSPIGLEVAERATSGTGAPLPETTG